VLFVLFVVTNSLPEFGIIPLKGVLLSIL